MLKRIVFRLPWGIPRSRPTLLVGDPGVIGYGHDDGSMLHCSPAGELVVSVTTDDVGVLGFRGD